jgi:DNA-binding IclR family transcriptional regulator
MVETVDMGIDEKDARAPRSQTLVRGLEILDAAADQPRTIAEIASMTGLIAAISVSSTLEYMSPERMRDLVPEVQRVARAISADLGARSR